MNATYFLDVAFRVDRAIRTNDRGAYLRVLTQVRADGHHQLADRIDAEMHRAGTFLQAADQEK